MIKPDYYKKLVYWLRFSGWLCLGPASGYLLMYQMVRGSIISLILLGALVITIIFAVVLLVTARQPFWLKPSHVMMAAVFAFLFVSLFITLFLLIAYARCRKLNEKNY